MPYHRFFVRQRRIAALMAALLTAVAPAALAADGATVVMYHRFGEGKYPSTNIRLDQFEAHLATLKAGGYAVLPLPRIVAALREGRTLPDKAVAITVDDAYLSVYKEAWPRLKAAGYTFTLFLDTGSIDAGTPGQMTWDQIRELRDAGVTIGSQTRSHPHMPRLSEQENREELARSQQRFAEELGKAPDLIAYPYGEASTAVMDIARQNGFIAGFGQHSGGLPSDGEMFYLPRFALNETYGDLERFRTAIDALPLPVSDVTPADPLLTDNNPPSYGFTVAEAAGDLNGLTCFSSHEGRVAATVLGRRVEVRPKTAFPPGRGRINCTLPGPGGRWRWFGMQFVTR